MKKNVELTISHIFYLSFEKKSMESYLKKKKKEATKKSSNYREMKLKCTLLSDWIVAKIGMITGRQCKCFENPIGPPFVKE